jgi:DNA-binding SARP family transcriptional activator/Tfp pilus assembly protein PilF
MSGDRSGEAGALVRGYRGKAGLTQRQLADSAGVSIGVVRDLEQRRTAGLQAESVRRLAVALRLDRRQAAEFAQAARRASAAEPGRSQVLRLGVLGPLQARRDAAIPLGGPMQRAVLGLLALHPESGLRRTVIIDALWGNDPPATAVSMIQSYVSRLRFLLGAGGPDTPLVAMASGYRLRAAGCDFDQVTFATLVSHARDRHAEADLPAACEAYDQALDLWRGEPLADVDALRHHPAVTRLNMQRAEAVVGYAEAAAAAGWHDRALVPLQELAEREPLNERAHARLMIALAGSGQQAVALRLYRALRRRLDDQLGVLPGAELTDAHARVLRQDVPGGFSGVTGAAAGPANGYSVPPVASGDALGTDSGRGLHQSQQVLTADPGLATPSTAEVTVGSPASAEAQPGQQPQEMVPRQLPPHGGHFTGRAAELAELTGLLDQVGGQTPGMAVISAIGGTAGVGKTALALHWAHQAAEHFPDGQLYVNLRGYDPDQPMPAADALAGFLRALGVAGQDIPAEADERAARYRSMLAGKRMLVLADNAREVEQVRPLLPGTGGSVVVVTSRDSLAGLVARDGARRLELDLLPLADAVGLLRALIGERVDADPGAAALAVQCSRLPLALRVVAELAVARPGVSLADLAGELADQRRRLDLLAAGGDPRTAVRAVFSWSYRYLDPGAARTFRLLGLHPGPDLDAYAAAALTGSTVERAGHMLDLLTRAYLIYHAAGPGRYGMHDLLRVYAAGLTADEDTENERRAALTRLFDHYLHTAAAAMDTLVPAERHRRPRIPSPATPGPPVTGPAAARGWLDAERANLVAVAAHTAGHGWPGHATHLAATLFRYLDTGCHYPEAVTIHTHALTAAHGIGDDCAEATALTNLGLVGLRQGRCQQATGQLQRALALFRETGDRTGEGVALSTLGIIDWELGRYQQATHHFERALALYRETGDRIGEARALTNLGAVDQLQGNYQYAADHLHQALALHREFGDRSGVARALCNLGCLDQRLGRYLQAAGYQRQALALHREIGDRSGEAHALSDLGDTSLRLGRYPESADYQRQALALFREIGDRYGEVEALNGLGEILLATGRPGLARAQHTTALTMASQIGDQDQQARAHNGLAYGYRAVGHAGQARHHWQEALALYASLGAPEADQVRAQLTTADDHGHHEP